MKRYGLDVEVGDDRAVVKMVEMRNGDYIMFEDADVIMSEQEELIEALEARIEELGDEIADLNQQLVEAEEI